MRTHKSAEALPLWAKYATPPANRPWEGITMDLVTDLRPSRAETETDSGCLRMKLPPPEELLPAEKLLTSDDAMEWRIEYV